MRRAACQMIEIARDSGARVIAAGADVSDTPEPYLRAGADVALLGEGLSSLQALLARLEMCPQAQALSLTDGLSGVASLNDGKVTAVNGSQVLPAAQYDGLPAWELVDIEQYRDVWIKAHGYFSLNMAASRGCSFRCAWCAKPIWGNQYLQRKPEAVAMEMAYLKHSFGADHVWFADDIFGFRAAWVSEFASAIKAEAGSIPFTIQTRADLVSERMATALRDAGCREAWLGAESGSQRVLNAMNKGTTVGEIRSARARLKRAGIRVGFFIQLGYLDEELDDILATRELLETAIPDDVGVSVSYPLPGTKFYELVRAQLGSKTHWQESNDLEMMFHGTYSSNFYLLIRDLLHERISLEILNSPQRSDEYQRGRHALERRWQELLSSERQYRNGRAASA
jgi:anaerobic magnesium-protoporphyrin IX monomethyl ester cyclase